jgi:hypothetical protein
MHPLESGAHFEVAFSYKLQIVSELTRMMLDLESDIKRTGYLIVLSSLRVLVPTKL